MSTKTLERKVEALSQEVALLRSAVIGIIAERDPEGEYRPEFVKQMLKLARKAKGGVDFTAGADFL